LTRTPSSPVFKDGSCSKKDAKGKQLSVSGVRENKLQRKLKKLNQGQTQVEESGLSRRLKNLVNKTAVDKGGGVLA